MSIARDNIISFLLQSDDNKDHIIADLQKKIALLEKQLADSPTAPAPFTDDNPTS